MHRYKVALLPSVTEPMPFRLCVPAATVVIHGPGLRNSAGPWTVIAGRSGDENACIGGEQERDLLGCKEMC